jgi:hypothetical protein
MNTETTHTYQDLFQCLRSRLCSPDFQARYRQHPQDFTRQRCLTFVVVVCFLLNLLKRALQDELDEFFKVLLGADFAERVVTKSAFSQARQKLNYAAFIELNQAQVSYFYDHLAPTRWHGWRLVAVDGSMAELPNTPQIGAHFGVWHPAAGGECPKARLSQMFDVLNRVTLDALIVPKKVGEREAAARHFAHLQAGDLVLVDRGYPAFWLFALILSCGAHFCARFNLDGWKVVETFLASGRVEQLVTLEPSAEARKECQARGLAVAPLTLRLVRIELASGGVEVLGTTLLDPQAYPYTLFKELYHDRWPVEEDYKAMKSRMEVENWSGESVSAVYQDFHAKVFTKNLTAMLAHPIETELGQISSEKQYRYRPNMTHALSKMKDTVVLLLQPVNPLSLLRRLWHLMLKTVEPVRPGRSYPRVKRVKRRRFAVNYKPIR